MITIKGTTLTELKFIDVELPLPESRVKQLEREANEFISKNKTMCPMPFNHMAVRPDGQIFPCCYWRWDASDLDDAKTLTTHYDDPFNHAYMVETREKMKKNEYVDGCRGCYQDEKETGESMRTHFIHDGREEGVDWIWDQESEPELRNIDLSISNKCNNKCRMCGPQLSTQWHSDAKKLGRSDYDEMVIKGQKGVTSNPFLENYDFSKLKHVKLLGGEPMMEQEWVKKLLRQVDRSDFSIKIVTNVTLYPDKELVDLLIECKSVTIDLSIDAYGKLNEFARKGSKWLITNDIVDYYIKMNNEHGWNINVHGVATIYNINKLHELIDYCDERNLYLHIHMCDGPKYMLVRNLPEDCKPQIRKLLEEQKDKYPHIGVYSNLLSELDEEGDFSRFVLQDEDMNEIRGEHFIDVNPELFEIMYGFLPKR